MTRELDDILRDEMFDSREVIERADELEESATEDPSEFGCTYCQEGSMPDGELTSLCADHADELRALRRIIAECEGVADWPYGETFIREDYFTDYARQLADDIGAVNADAQWPTSYIDWDAAADALRQDYTEFRIEGTSYYARA